MAQAEYLKKIVGLAVQDEEFRKAVIANPTEAIDSHSKQLGFNYSQLSKEDQDVLSSFTAEELDTLGRIYLRAKSANIPIDPVEMF